MKRSTKSNRVSWASGVDLCQVKHFYTEDCPSKIGMQVQEHLVRKTSLMLHRLSGNETVDFPPGFGSGHKLNRLKEEASQIARIEWRCSPKFVMSREWHVAAGEESQEKDAQNLRELGLLEAIYPRVSAIPHGPSVSTEVEVEHWNDSLTPVVPLTPIEEEEAADILTNSVEPRNATMCSQSSELSQSSVMLNCSESHNHVSEAPASQKPVLPNFGADLVTAASAALAAVVKSKERGSLIDTDLLVKILSDPDMIEKLINDSQAPASAISLPMLALKPDSIPLDCSKQLAPLAPIAGNDKLYDLQGGMPPVTKPGMTSVTPVPGPTMFATPKPSNGCSPHLRSDVKPNRVAVSVPEIQQVAPSFPMPPSPPVGNLYTKPSLLPTQPNTVPKSSPLPLKPNAILNQMLPFSNPLPTQPNGIFQPPTGAMKINRVKDVNYIKNLIREHGADKQDKRDLNMLQNGTHYNLHSQNMEMAQKIKTGEAKPSKYQKPCAYFTSSTGCRNGSNCPYQHDLSYKWRTGRLMQAPSAKRIKFGGEIAGR